MDRFIAMKFRFKTISLSNLKSNMDRFIGGTSSNIEQFNKLFKIQYGQIYRMKDNIIQATISDLKSNMDRFIAVEIRRL